MTVREFLNLFVGLPLEADVVLVSGVSPEGLSYDALNHLVIINAMYDEDEVDDYFTDEDLEESE